MSGTTNPPPPARRGGLWAGLRAGARCLWRGLMTEMGRKPPRVVRRAQWWHVSLTAAPPFFCLGVLMFAIKSNTFTSVPWFYIMCGVFALSIGLQLVLWRRVYRTRSRAASLDYRICPECGYSLVDLDEVGMCPECGTPYNPVELEVVWKRK